jgi:hypothetical protein
VALLAIAPATDMKPEKDITSGEDRLRKEVAAIIAAALLGLKSTGAPLKPLAPAPGWKLKSKPSRSNKGKNEGKDQP